MEKGKTFTILMEWIFCPLVQLHKQFSAFGQIAILIELYKEKGETFISHSDGVDFSNKSFHRYHKVSK